MDRLTRTSKEEEEEEEPLRRKSRDSGRSEGASPEPGEEEDDEEDALHQRGYLFLSGSRVSVEEQEEETDVDAVPAFRQEKSVRWTDVCQRDDRGRVKEEVKTEERIKQQLFSGVC